VCQASCRMLSMDLYILTTAEKLPT
jgi:hypothetical protein